MALKTYPIQPDAKGHRTRGSDSSFYDEVCVTCGATDAGTALNGVCPNQISDELHAAERLETAKRQLIGMGPTMIHMLRNHGPQVDTFWTKELDRLADMLELLLEERQKINAPIVANVSVDLGAELLKGKTPEEQEEMRQGFAKWFDIQRAKSVEIKATNTPSKRAIPIVAGEIVLPGGGISPLGMDDRDAEDFGVPVEIVEKARATYQAEQARTHLFFMSDWFSLARFKRREYVRQAAAE